MVESISRQELQDEIAGVSLTSSVRRDAGGTQAPVEKGLPLEQVEVGAP